MTTLPAPVDAIAESQRLIAALEQRRGELPFVDGILETHRSMHRELETTHTHSEQAVNEWRRALARRWECEVAGRRLYKQVLRQIVDHYGGQDAPQVLLLSRGGAEAESSPTELLEDLRRLRAALELDGHPLPFASQRTPQIERVQRDLERSIAEANACEHRRRTAVLDSRMVREVYRRVRGETCKAIMAHYGEQVPQEFHHLVQ